jgi:hypothetical protein
VNIPTRAQLIDIGIGAFVVAVMVFGAFQRGKEIERQRGQLQANALLIHMRDSITKAASTREAILQRTADSLVRDAHVWSERYKAARGKVIVRADTIYADSQSVVLPDVASLIKTCDITIKNDSLAIVALKVDAVAKDSVILGQQGQIAVRDSRIVLLEKITAPRFGFRSGVVVGAAIVVAIVRFVVIR